MAIEESRAEAYATGSRFLVPFYPTLRQLFHGDRGRVRKRYREGQEDQPSSLGLVLNAVALWNTLYLDKAVSHLREGGQEIRNEDLAHVSPLMHAHVRVLGRYHFRLDQAVASGGLRPLRDPEAIDELEVPAGL